MKTWRCLQVLEIEYTGKVTALYRAGLKPSPTSPWTNHWNSGPSSLHQRQLTEHTRHVQHQEETLRNGSMITLLKDLRPLWVLFFNSCAVFSLLTKPSPGFLLKCFSFTSETRPEEGYTIVTTVWSPWVLLYPCSSSCSGANAPLRSQLYLGGQG